MSSGQLGVQRRHLETMGLQGGQQDVEEVESVLHGLAFHRKRGQIKTDQRTETRVIMNAASEQS